jgi:hypothetical protein
MNNHDVCTASPRAQFAPKNFPSTGGGKFFGSGDAF